MSTFSICKWKCPQMCLAYSRLNSTNSCTRKALFMHLVFSSSWSSYLKKLHFPTSNCVLSNFTLELAGKWKMVAGNCMERRGRTSMRNLFHDWFLPNRISHSILNVYGLQQTTKHSNSFSLHQKRPWHRVHLHSFKTAMFQWTFYLTLMLTFLKNAMRQEGKAQSCKLTWKAGVLPSSFNLCNSKERSMVWKYAQIFFLSHAKFQQ